MTAKEVQEWAEQVSFSDDIGREKGYANVVHEALGALSNEPDQETPLTPKRANEIISELNSSPFDPSTDDDSY